MRKSNHQPAVPPESRRQGDSCRRSKSSASTPRQAGSAPRPKRHPFLDQLAITGCHDQNGDLYVRVKHGENEVVFRVEEAGDGGALGSRLTKAGIIAVQNTVKSAVQAEIQGLSDWSEAITVARRPGYIAGVQVLPDGTIAGRPEQEVFVSFDRPAVPLSRKGSFREWRNIVERYCTGQDNCILVLALAFCGPVLELLPGLETILIDAVAGSSSGKSTIGKLLASTAGGLSKIGGIATTWRTTITALERDFAARYGCFAVLDEGNSAGPTKTSRVQFIADAGHLLNEEAGRGRSNEATLILRLVGFSTSNKSVFELEAQAHTEDFDHEAIGVRILTVPADLNGGLGIWNSLPAGHDNPAQASQSLVNELAEHHGWAFGRFARKFARQRAKDPQALITKLTDLRRKFLERTGAAHKSGLERRRAEKWATIYAAGTLACELHVLPFKSIGPNIERSYRRAEALMQTVATQDITAYGRVLEYMADHAAEIVDLHVQEAPSLSDAELNAAPGFLTTFLHRRCFVFRTGTATRLWGGRKMTALKELQTQGRLIAREGFQSQVRLRQGEDKARVYVVPID